MHLLSIVPTDKHVVFYPIGNTPAANFLDFSTRSSTSGEPVEALTLACGDPRSILYSLWCEGAAVGRRINFTCCDLEPAVLARNILLFSLMIDNAAAYEANDIKRLSSIWNLCYHFFIPKADLNLVRSQATRLLDLSEDEDRWSAGPYSVVSFVSKQTLEEVRGIWKRYSVERSNSQQKKYETAKRAEVKKVFTEHYSGGGASMTFYAGPHWQDGLDAMGLGLRGYWQTGVVGGNTADVEALGTHGVGFANPMIMISAVSEKFVVHYTSDPLTSYHLASVFDNSASKAKDVNAMILLAKRQFREWSRAFVDHAKSGALQVRFYFGEAVNFCHELVGRNGNQSFTPAIARAYASQWSSKPLLLDGKGANSLPESFDVIDTSNLVDWVTLPAVLCPTIHLLKRKTTSVIWTETFRLFSEEPKNDLTENLYMDVELGSLLMGVSPLGHILGYAMDNTLGEDINYKGAPNRYRMRVAWKFPVDHETHSLIIQRPHELKARFDPEELACIMFRVYLKMFASEDLEAEGNRWRFKKPLNSRLFNRSTRVTFANLIRHVQGQVNTDVKPFLDSLLSKIRNEKKLQTGNQCLLELILQLTMSGAMPSFLPIQAGEPPRPAPFKCLTLVVPREELDVFEENGTVPGIHLGVQKKKNLELFFGIDCFFGSVKQNKDGTWAEIVDDPTGWAGTSDLIVTTAVPPQLVQGKFDCYLLVMLSFLSLEYMEALGPEMSVYGANSKEDKQNIFISEVPPRNQVNCQAENLHNPPYVEQAETDKAITISASRSSGELILQAKYKITPESEEAVALGSGAIVKLSDITPCSMLLKIGDNCSRRLGFPYPIDGVKAKTRIARKSLWIEVSAPASPTLLTGGYNVAPFPVILEPGSQPSVWSLPRIDLDQQPKITGKMKTWLPLTLHQFTSNRECRMLLAGYIKDVDHRIDLPLYKTCLNKMFMEISESKTPQALALSVVKNDELDIDMIIVPSCVRHGRETGGMYLDAWVVTLVGKGPSGRSMEEVGEGGDMQAYPMRKEELFFWKNLLPAAAETCRVGWEHRGDCQYLSRNKVPLSVEPGESPICDCGEGKDVTEYPPGAPFEKMFRRYGVRIALPTLAAPPYVEETGNLDQAD